MKDDLGDRMKSYEKKRTGEKLDSGSIVYARIDGRGFSKFTRGMDKPFDVGLRNTMIEVTRALVQKTLALIGYTQSDEISLAWRNSDLMQFNGKIQKLTSILAGMATSHFIIEGLDNIDPPSIILERYPHFDARVFELPDLHELTNAFLWRYKDANRNAIMMIAQSVFSHKKLNKKNVKEVIEMLAEVGIFVNDFDKESIFGTFIYREKIDHVTYTRDTLIKNAIDFSKMPHEERYHYITGEKI